MHLGYLYHYLIDNSFHYMQKINTTEMCFPKIYFSVLVGLHNLNKKPTDQAIFACWLYDINLVSGHYKIFSAFKYFPFDVSVYLS